MSWRRILVAVGPNGIGTIELNKAGRVALGANAEVELFQCVHGPHFAHQKAESRAVDDEVQQQLDSSYRALEDPAVQLRAAGVPVTLSVRWDYPVHASLIREVQRTRADLLICQSTPRSRTVRRLLTQTDYKLIESCPCPVLMIKTRQPYCQPRIIAAVDPEPLEKLDADFAGELEDEIVGSATTLAGALGGEALLLSVSKRSSGVVEGSPSVQPASQSSSQEASATDANGVRGNLLTLARRHGIPEERLTIVGGDAIQLLPRAADRDGAQIMVMGVVSRSRVERLVIGHTAERILDDLYCDVLVVKTH